MAVGRLNSPREPAINSNFAGKIKNGVEILPRENRINDRISGNSIENSVDEIDDDEVEKKAVPNSRRTSRVSFDAFRTN